MPYFKEDFTDKNKKPTKVIEQKIKNDTEEDIKEMEEENEEDVIAVPDLGTGILEIKNDIANVEWKQIVKDSDGGHVFQSSNGLLLFCNIVVKQSGLFKKEVTKTWNITSVNV